MTTDQTELLIRQGVEVSQGKIRLADMNLAVSTLVEAVPFNSPPSQFEFDQPEYNKFQYDGFIWNPPKLVTDSKRCSLVHEDLKTKGTFIALDYKAQKVAYCMEYRVMAIEGRRCVSQIMVWSDEKYSEKVKGLPVHVFAFNWLLDNHSAVVTDRDQTLKGKKFWYGQLERAYLNYRYVYRIVDKGEKTKATITRLPTLADLNKLKGNIWGESVDRRYQRVAIAKAKIW